MSVKIRMTRTGANNEERFRVVATDSRRPRDGRVLETLGWYDPSREENEFSLKLDRIDYWTGQGAILSDTVRSLVKKAKKAAVGV